jgi:hypothetical protein
MKTNPNTVGSAARAANPATQTLQQLQLDPNYRGRLSRSYSPNT